MSKKAKPDKKQQQIDELTADVKRIQAEFINFKKRSEEEKDRIGSVAKGATIKELLPVIDDLERALGHLPKELEKDKWAQGVLKVYDRLLKQLEKLGVKKLEAKDQLFNPEVHEAVQVEGEGDIQIVSEVLQEGYELNGEVIRHAVVKVVNK